MRRHLVQIGISALSVLLAVFLLNRIVDPYRIWGASGFAWVPSAKPQIAMHERAFKTVGLAPHPSKAVILGTSRSDVGLDPTHPAFGTEGMNLATSGQPYRETRRIFEFIVDRGVVRSVVIGLDFFKANSLLGDPADFTEDNFSFARKWQLGFSSTTAIDSIATLYKRTEPPGDTWTDRGLHIWNAVYVRQGGGHRKLMLESQEGYLRKYYLPPPACLFSFSGTVGNASPMDDLRNIFSLAHRHRIALKLAISPSHAWQWETLAAAGLWDRWEEWKRKLVAINEEEAARTGAPPFPLFDFSGFDEISTESVPPIGDIDSAMRWYFDSSHYTTAVGDLMLDRIYDYKDARRVVPPGFGIRITRENLEDHLQGIRLARQRYRESHLSDMAELALHAKHVLANKTCKVLGKHP